MNIKPRHAAAAAALALAAVAPVQAQTLGAEFAATYTLTDLGSVADLPSNYGGLAFVDADTIVIGGAANGPAGSLYTVDVVRNAQNHITGFSGSAQRFGGAGG